MRAISERVRNEVLKRKQECERRCDGDCSGRITWEHCWIYGGRQIDEAWAIVLLCEYHHAVNMYQDRGDLDKLKNQWLSLQKATPEELAKYPKKNWIQEKIKLQHLYGNYN